MSAVKKDNSNLHRLLPPFLVPFVTVLLNNFTVLECPENLSSELNRLPCLVEVGFFFGASENKQVRNEKKSEMINRRS